MENMAGSMSMPNETKKMAAKASRNGEIFFSMRSMTLVSANTIPMKKAPMRGGTPQKTAKAAERKTTPSMNRTKSSSLSIFTRYLTTRGMTKTANMMKKRKKPIMPSANAPMLKFASVLMTRPPTTVRMIMEMNSSMMTMPMM